MLALFSLVFAAVALARCPCPNECGPVDDCTLCKADGVSRLSRSRCTSSCYTEAPNKLVFVQPPCSLDLGLPTGNIIGKLICRKPICELSSLETRVVSEADEKCSRLSPISFHFDHETASNCQSYLTQKSADDGCDDGFKAYCVYPEISDDLGDLQTVISADAVYIVVQRNVIEVGTTPFNAGFQCPPVNGQRAFASWCLSSTETPVPAAADLGLLIAQNVDCLCDDVREIVKNHVGCFKTVEGPKGSCPVGQNAVCYYEVSK